MKELFRTDTEECPACQTRNVHKVARIDPTLGQHSADEAPANELWACRDCALSFIKGPTRVKWVGRTRQ